MTDCTVTDGDLHILEGKAAFLAMAANAIGMLDEGDYEAIQSQKAWEGLGWYTEELESTLREINLKINSKNTQ